MVAGHIYTCHCQCSPTSVLWMVSRLSHIELGLPYTSFSTEDPLRLAVVLSVRNLLIHYWWTPIFQTIVLASFLGCFIQHICIVPETMPRLQALCDEHMVIEVLSGVVFSCCVTTCCRTSDGVIPESTYRSAAGIGECILLRDGTCHRVTSTSLQ